MASHKSHLWNHPAVMVKSMVSGVSFPKQSIDPLIIAKLHTSRGPLWSRAGVPPNDPYLHRRKVITWDHTSKNWTDLNSSWFILIQSISWPLFKSHETKQNLFQATVSTNPAAWPRNLYEFQSILGSTRRPQRQHAFLIQQCFMSSRLLCRCSRMRDQHWSAQPRFIILGMVYYFWGWWFTVDDDFGEGLLLGLPFTKAVFIIKKMCSSQNGREWKGSRRYRLCCRASHARCQWSAIRTFGDCPYRILSPRKVMIKFHPDHQNPSYSSHPIILFQASPVWHSHLMSIIQISPDLLPSAYKSPKRWMASFKITFVAWGCFAWPLATRSAQKACSSSPTPGCTGIMTVSGHQKFIFQQPFSTPFQAFSLSSK